LARENGVDVQAIAIEGGHSSAEDAEIRMSIDFFRQAKVVTLRFLQAIRIARQCRCQEECPLAKPERTMDQGVLDPDNTPNAVTSSVHDRMPVILDRHDYDL